MCVHVCNEACLIYSEIRWRQSGSLFWFISHLRTIGVIVTVVICLQLRADSAVLSSVIN